MIIRQLLDPETSTYTYLLTDEQSREALSANLACGEKQEA